MEKKALDQNSQHIILQEIDTRLNEGLLPVHNGHLDHLGGEGGDVLERLLLLKREGLISGDVVARGADKTPCRMTNIRLTYLGIRTLRWWLENRARSHKESA